MGPSFRKCPARMSAISAEAGWVPALSNASKDATNECRRLAPDGEGEEEDVTIAVAELLGFVTFAAARSRDWAGKVIFYVGDNTNTIGWLLKEGAKCRYARHLLRVLTYLRLRDRWVLVPAYIRTYHNGTCDFASREAEEVVRKELEGDMPCSSKLQLAR